MHRILFSVLLVVSVAFPQWSSAQALSVGPDLGWTLRQIAISPPDGAQRDLVYQQVNFGLGLESGTEDGLFVGRFRVSYDVMGDLQEDGSSLPGTLSQNTMTVEVMPILTTYVGDIGFAFGAGVSFVHYFDAEFRGEDKSEVPSIFAKQAIQMPVMLGLRVRTDDVIITTELGAAYAFAFDTTDPVLKDQIANGSAQVQNLDVWLRVGLAFPVL